MFVKTFRFVVSDEYVENFYQEQNGTVSEKYNSLKDSVYNGSKDDIYSESKFKYN